METHDNQQEVWDEVAGAWSSYRREPMIEVEEFLKGKWGRILDVGCGSGRHFGCIEGEIYGVDFSEKMIEIAERKARFAGMSVHLEQAEADKLPFGGDFFDAVICIATLHCVTTPEKRKKAIEEIFHVLKPGSMALITVWSRNQKRIHGRIGDVLIPWTVKDKKLMRYYYIYSKEEIEQLLQDAGFEIIYSEEDENIMIEAMKPL